MNKYQKELIEKCEPYPIGMPFQSFYVIPSGVSYNGFWGKNGYNKIYIVCTIYDEKQDKEKFYLVGEKYQVDVLQLGDFLKPTLAISCDIPNKLNCLHFFNLDRSKKFVIKDVLSSVVIEVCE